MRFQVRTGALVSVRPAWAAASGICLFWSPLSRRPPIGLAAIILNPISLPLSASTRTDYSKIVQGWLPVAAAVGVIVTAFTYFLTNKKERRLRFEDRIAENIGVLIDFSSNHSITIGKAYNAFRNLHALGKAAGKKSYMDLNKRVADAIVQIVSFDIDLDDGRQVRFDALALDLWPGYSTYLSAMPKLHEGVLYRYTDALRKLRLSDPRRFSAVQRDASGKYTFSPPISDSKLQHFDTLVMNYQRHVELMQDSAKQGECIRKFSEALENRKLTEQIFSHSTGALLMTNP